jgi:hypothetical protein
MSLYQQGILGVWCIASSSKGKQYDPFQQVTVPLMVFYDMNHSEIIL